MLKVDAITLLGGTVTAVAEAVGITTSAVSQWPDELPPSIRDRVQAALYRRQQIASTQDGSATVTEAQTHLGP